MVMSLMSLISWTASIASSFVKAFASFSFPIRIVAFFAISLTLSIFFAIRLGAARLNEIFKPCS